MDYNHFSTVREIRVTWLILLIMAPMLLGCGDRATSLLSRSKAYYEKGKKPEAFAACNEAIQSDPSNPKAYWFRAYMFNREGKMTEMTEAIADLSEVIRLAPEFPEGYLARAVALSFKLDILRGIQSPSVKRIHEIKEIQKQIEADLNTAHKLSPDCCQKSDTGWQIRPVNYLEREPHGQQATRRTPELPDDELLSQKHQGKFEFYELSDAEVEDEAILKDMAGRCGWPHRGFGTLREATEFRSQFRRQVDEFEDIVKKLDLQKPENRVFAIKEFVRIFGEKHARHLGLMIYDQDGRPKYVWPQP